MTSQAAPPGLLDRMARIPPALAAGGLLAVFALTASLSSLRDSVTMDETAHLAAGLSYLQRGDFRMNPEHPPLAKMWAALPLWIAGPRDADYGSPHWRKGDAWRFGFEYLNGPLDDPQRRDPSTRLVPARFAMIALGLLLGLVIHAWAKALHGTGGGLVALALYAFSPTVLAHTRLVTTDIPVTLGFALCLWLFWRWQSSPTWRRALLTGLALGAALLMKFSALLLLPSLALLLALREVRNAHAPDRGKRGRIAAAHGALALLAAFILVWAGYGFRSAASASPEFQLDWSLGIKGGPSWTTSALRSTPLLPEAYRYGLASAAAQGARRAYLNGEIAEEGGWWHYFPEAFLLKSTPAFLALLAFLLWSGLRRTRGRSWDGWMVAAPALLYAAVAIAGRFNIGLRHLLPVYPILFVLAGAASREWAARGWRCALVAFLLASHAGSSLWTFPRYIPYFNFMAGGSAGAWRYLLDSNLDWGQDLIRLREKMRDHSIDRVYLVTFGSGDPRAYGIEYRKIFMYMDLRDHEAPQRPGPGDCVAVSLSMLHGLYVDDRGGWLAGLRRLAPLDRAGDSIVLYRLPP